MSSDGEEPESLYRKPLTPETAALLAALTDKQAAPPKAKKGKVGKAKRPTKARPCPPAGHDAHVLAYRPYRLPFIIAERMASVPAEPAPYIAALGPEGWGIKPDSPQATSMGQGYSTPGVRIA